MKNIIRMDYPAQWWPGAWREALPSGNSRIGAAVYGQVHEETILVNHEDLWAHSIEQDLPHVTYKLAEIRPTMAVRANIDQPQNIF